jgi:hypothetical protein
MFENTASELAQCINTMRDVRDIDDLDMNEYEQEGFKDLYYLSQQYIANYKRLARDLDEEL